MQTNVDPRHARIAFERHLGSADALLSHLAEHLRLASTAAGADEREAARVRARMAWESLWDQLARARAIVGQLGRSAPAYEIARLGAGDASAPLDAPRYAIAALRAAMPA